MATDLACSQLILLVLVGSNLRLYFERELLAESAMLGMWVFRTVEAVMVTAALDQ